MEKKYNFISLAKVPLVSCGLQCTELRAAPFRTVYVWDVRLASNKQNMAKMMNCDGVMSLLRL